MPKKKLKKGYTLTEVLVVVLIIGVLSAIAYPVYTKAINKSRAIEAMNLLEMVRNKQIANFARKGAYLPDFTDIGQLTTNPEQETINGNKMTIGKYELAIYPEGSCMTSAYIPAKNKAPIFTFSSGYEEAGLGCEGSVCSTFGNIVGGKESVCNCGNKNCGANFLMDAVSCACSCPLDCNQNNLCYDKTQTQTTVQSCGYNNSGTQTRSCSASCNGGDCGSWGSCTGQSCNTSTKPTTSQSCASGCGTQSRTVTCDNGTWVVGGWSGTCTSPTQTLSTSKSCGVNNSGTQTRTCTATCGGGSCGEWGDCTGQSCIESSKPEASQTCASGCGTQTRTVTCNNGTWTTGNWGGSCSSPTQTQTTTQSCGTNNSGTQTRTCTASCEGGTCGEWGACTGEAKECPSSSKPTTSQACGNCGTQTRTVTCDTKTGNWTSGDWASCTSEGTCKPSATQSCGNGGTQTCSDSCAWGSCTGEAKECPSSSKPTASQACGNCGTQSRTVSCDTKTGSWTNGDWGSCTGEGTCKAGATQSCGNGGTQTCSDSCAWGSCTGEAKECPSSSKPTESQACGNCGTQSRTVTCDTKTGNWTSADWGSCTGTGACAPNATQSCGNGGTQTCSSACAWGTCVNTCSSPKSRWDGTRCTCPGSYDYYHSGTCCSYLTPKTDTRCWGSKCTSPFRWTTHGPYEKTIQNSYLPDVASFTGGVTTMCNSSYIADNLCQPPASSGEVCIKNYSVNSGSGTYKATYTLFVCLPVQECLDNQALWDPTTETNY